jgi:hypothetical protein
VIQVKSLAEMTGGLRLYIHRHLSMKPFCSQDALPSNHSSVRRRTLSHSDWFRCCRPRGLIEQLALLEAWKQLVEARMTDLQHRLAAQGAVQQCPMTTVAPDGVRPDTPWK